MYNGLHNVIKATRKSYVVALLSCSIRIRRR